MTPLCLIYFPLTTDVNGIIRQIFDNAAPLIRDPPGTEKMRNRTAVRAKNPAGSPDPVTGYGTVLLPQLSFSQRATSLAKYVRIMSAPARLKAIISSMTTAFSSIQPFAAAALIIEYSPLTL